MASKKAEQDKADREAAEARKKEKQAEKEAAAQAKKEEAEAKKAAREEEKAQKEQEREEAKAAKEKEKAEARQKLIDDGKLIEEGDVEYVEVDKSEKEAVLDNRAVAVLEKLQGSDTPLLGKDLQEEFGGGWPLYIPMFSVLKAQGLIKEYRRRTGERGGSGVAYLWVGSK